ncbi:MAG: glycosyl hydrolase family 28-related protein [Ferruginibacter sp.]
MKKILTRILALLLLFGLLSTQSFARVINVKTFGAKGDGKTDDTKSIQRAINAAPETSLNTIYFPKGTYLVGSYTVTKEYFENYCLRIHPGILFKGDGKTSVIRLSDHLFDNRDTMANAHLFFGRKICNVQFTDILIDMNGMNNLVPEDIIKNNTAIYIRDGNNVAIKNITIKNCSGRDMVIISGNGSNATIEESTFLNGGNYVGSEKPNKFQTDFSFLYTEWDSVAIINNHIEQQNVDLALGGFTGGIEIHGSYCNATGNIIIGCYPGIFISSSWHAMEKTIVENNQFLQCIKGVSFWVNYPMNNISVQNNIIQLTYSRLLKPGILAGIVVPNGNINEYSFKLANNAPLTHLLIKNNVITSLVPDNTKDITAGMVLHSLQKSTIEKNTISGMNYGGLVLQGSKWGIDSLIITSNKISDFKTNNDPKAVGGYVIITDTYSITTSNAAGMRNIYLVGNSFIQDKFQAKSIYALPEKGKFFGAFVALPGIMHKQIHFDKNNFSNPEEKVFFLKTD